MRGILSTARRRLRPSESLRRFTNGKAPLSSLADDAGSEEGGSETRETEPIDRRRDTIVAPATATGRAAAVAVVRVSGPNADAVLRGLMPEGNPLPEPRVATLVKLVRKGGGESHRLLDRALALRFPRPRSYTGEDVVELHVHGGTAVVSSVMEAVLDSERGKGLIRVARPGEFTRRAFEAGKVDLTAAEGLADLLSAADDASAARAAALADGRLRRAAERWRRRAVELLAAAEAAAEFEDDPSAMSLVEEERGGGDGGDDDEARSVAAGVAEGAGLLADSLDDALAASASSSSSAGSGGAPRVALLGLPNAGKSSLLNALTRTEAAIVTSEPGTTRDVLEATVELRRSGKPLSSPAATVVVCDTAGVRSGKDGGEDGGRESDGEAEKNKAPVPLSAAEREGVRRALEAASASRVVVLVVDGEELARDASRGRGGAREAELAGLATRAMGRPPSAPSSPRRPGPKSLVVAVNKCDRFEGEGAAEGREGALAAATRVARRAGGGGASVAVLPLSAATGEGLGALVDAIRSSVAATAAESAPPPPSFLAAPLPLHTERHRAALSAASAALRRAAALSPSSGGERASSVPPSPELVAEELREAIDEIGSLSAGGGKGGATACDVDGEVLDAVFSRFCVGK